MSEEQDPTETTELEGAVDQATDAVNVQANELDELSELDASEATGDPIGIAHLMEVPVQVTVEVGQTKLSLADLIQLKPGSLVALNREAHEPADILVNGKTVARGEVVTVEGRYGVRISSVVKGS